MMWSWHVLIAAALAGTIAAMHPAAALTPTQPQVPQPQGNSGQANQVEQQNRQQVDQQQDDKTEIIALPAWRSNYNELYAGMSVEELLGADVHGTTGEDIGEVENLVIGKDGEVLSVIAEVGGFLELGDKHISIPWDRVTVGVDGDDLSIPLTQDTLEEFSLFADPRVTAQEARTTIQEVEGDDAGVVTTGPRAWRATELIGDHARLRDKDGFVNYGYVHDLIIRDGKVAAVVVSPDVTWGPGLYAYPYYGYWSGWHPAFPYYDLLMSDRKSPSWRLWMGTDSRTDLPAA